MNLHEYQAKALFRQYKIPVPHGVVVNNVDITGTVAEEIVGNTWVVKAQVHAGGREGRRCKAGFLTRRA